MVKTFNWDTAFILHFDDVNSAITAAGTTPTAFAQEVTTSGTTWIMDGTFDPWQLTGGGGGTLEMTLPITSGTLSDGTNSYDLSEIDVVVSFSLQKVPQPGATPTSGPNDFQPSDFTMSEPIYPTGFSFAAKLAFQQLMPDWLATKGSAIQLVLATVDLDRKLSQADKGIQWLLPTDTSYAVGKTVLGDYLFGVLSMVDNHSAAGNTQVLDSAAPTSPGRASFLVSPTVILNHMVRPGLVAMFSGATPDSFSINADGTELAAAEELTFANWQLSDDSTRTATLPVNGLVVRVDEGNLALSLEGISYEYSYDVQVMMNCDSTHTFSYKDGKIELELSEITPSANASSGGAAIGLAVAGAIASEVLITAIGVGIGSAFKTAEPGATPTRTVPGQDPAPTGAIAPTTQNVPPGGSNAVGAPSATVTGAQQAATELANPAGTTDQTGSFGRMNPKVKGALIAAAVGGTINAVVGAIPAIVAYIAQNDAAKIPTLQTFFETAVGTVVWPAGVKFTPDNVTLDGSLVIHGALG